jgi:type II secretory pathway component GspD/PulD (secretin)
MWRGVGLAALLALCLAPLARADGGKEWSGVNTKKGNPSPSGGSIWGHSNVDDYTNQDEQINIDGNRDAVVKVLRANQKNLVNQFEVRVFPIQNASPIEIRNAFRQITYAEGGRAEVIRDKKKKEYFLFCLAPSHMMPHIETALKALDQDWVQDNTDGSVDAYYQAKFRDVAKVTDIALIPASAEVDERDDNLITVDSVANAVHITGEPYRVSSFVKYAQKVDQPVPQVLLEATVYEVEVSNEKRLGVDYLAWKNGPGRNLFDFIYWGSDYDQKAWNITSVFDPFVPCRANANDPESIRGDASGWYMGANYLLTAAYLDFLEGSGRARVVTRGKVLVQNGETADLTAADEVLHFHVSPDEDETPCKGVSPDTVDNEECETGLPIYDRTVTKDEKLEIGFAMSVTPRISEEITQLSISLDLNNIVGQTPSGTPQVRTHSLSTTVLVQNDQEICVGGLKRTEDVKQVQKMPIVGSLPIVGWLFGHEATVRRETEMIVVLTPRIQFGSEKDRALMDDKDREVRRQIEQHAKLTLPRTEYGFDQWLIDEGKQGPTFE